MVEAKLRVETLENRNNNNHWSDEDFISFTTYLS